MKAIEIVEETHGATLYNLCECGYSAIDDADFIVHQIRNNKTIMFRQALKAVLEIHSEEIRYYLDESEENSWDSIEDVIAYYGDDEVAPEQVKSFSVCAECARMEINLAKLGDFEYAYEASHYPCPTVTAIEKALGVGE